MATTAIFAELLVVGLQVLAWLTIVVLGVAKKEAVIPAGLGDWSTLITLLIVALAYVLGVLMDRISDSVFKLIEHEPVQKEGDPPVSVKRLTVASRSEPVSRFLEYVRSRLRIARATSLNLALTTLAVAFWLARKNHGPWRVVVALVLGAIAASIALWVARRISKTYYERLTEAYELLLEKQGGVDPSH